MSKDDICLFLCMYNILLLAGDPGLCSGNFRWCLLQIQEWSQQGGRGGSGTYSRSRIKTEEKTKVVRIYSIPCRGRNWINTSPLTEATTFAFSSLFICLLWSGKTNSPQVFSFLHNLFSVKHTYEYIVILYYLHNN